MATAEKGTRITVDLGTRDRYRRLRIATAEQDFTIRDVVIEALDYWLDHQEEIEDALAGRLLEEERANPTERVPYETVKAKVAQAGEAREESAV